MKRLLEALIVAGAAAVFVACTESPTASTTATPAAAAGDVVSMAAPLPTGSCTYVQLNSGGYEFTITWSAMLVSSIEVSSTSGPSVQTTLGHPLRCGSLTGTTQTEPFTALLTGPSSGQRIRCIGSGPA